MTAPRPAPIDPFPPLLDAAVRFAAGRHAGQTRKGSGGPYVTHPLAVMTVLCRAGWADDAELLAAAALHDVLEDTPATPADLAAAFSPRVCELVAGMTERKRDAGGAKIPWETRKAEHRDRLAAGPPALRALALADKLHNLRSFEADLAADPNAWALYNAPRDRWLAVARATVAALRCDETADLAAACTATLDRLAAVPRAAADDDR